MNRVSIILFFFLLCLAPSIAYTNENAETLFKQQKYQEALDLWTNELKQGKQNDALHYNIGLAHLKLNQFPQSILHLEIALKRTCHSLGLRGIHAHCHAFDGRRWRSDRNGR